VRWTRGDLRTAARALEHDLVVETEPELWHAGKIALHLDCAKNLGTDDVALCVDEEVDALDDVEEDLVLPIADALCSPRDGVGYCLGRADLYLEFVGFLGNVPRRVSARIYMSSGARADSWRILLSVVWG
jgi:hypothetical protein